MTQEQEDEIFNDIIRDVNRNHHYHDEGLRSMARSTETTCGYIIWTTVTTNGEEQMDIDRAMKSLDEKEETYLRKLIRWNRVK